MSNTYPGFHKSVVLNHFDSVETKILERISKDWYVTNGGGEITLNQGSNYKYCLIKPVNKYKEMFNLDREVVVVFSPYNNFEPRTLDAFDHVFKKFQQLRVEKICSILISKDAEIDNKLKLLLKSDSESRIIINFNYEELLDNTDSYYIINKFRNNFYERDLFAYESPIKKDLFFFGRSDIVFQCINRHKTGENSGIFGLRKTGKTSVVFGIERGLSRDQIPSVFIDCQNPAFHRKRWNQSLLYVLREIKKQNNLACKIGTEESYTEEKASEKFERDILRLYKKLDNNPILIIFDEIEHITPDISPTKHWRNEFDFVYFWQTIRSVFQKLSLNNSTHIFSFLIVGTNPKCIEISTIGNTDNPIFNKIPATYIKGFDVNSTSEMVQKLGGYMGLTFDELIYYKLTDDFGGHPYLIRHMCSILNDLAPTDRPAKIDKMMYEEGKRRFNQDYSHYINMILGVLNDFYPNEYEMLIYLALGEIETFKEFAALSPTFISHLLGYNIIDKNGDNYTFKIESVKHYLTDIKKYERKLDNVSQRWKEVSERRNSIEPKLREIIRLIFQSKLGKADAASEILRILGDPRKQKHKDLSYRQLLDPNELNIYLSDLINIINKHYDLFVNIFGSNKDETITFLLKINEYRTDAHAKNMTQDDLDYFRVCMKNIESKVNDFL